MLCHVGKEVKSVFGSILKKNREGMSLSQREIAVELKYVNVNFISMIENGGSNMPINRFHDILGAYGIPGNAQFCIFFIFYPEIASSFIESIPCIGGRENSIKTDILMTIAASSNAFMEFCTGLAMRSQAEALVASINLG